MCGKMIESLGDLLLAGQPQCGKGVPIGIHMQIALEMTDGDEGGREELVLTWQGPTYP